MTTTPRLLLLAAVTLAGACASDPPPRAEREPEFGSSVRAMQRAQTHDPDAGRTAQPPAALDGAKAGAALDKYRASGKGELKTLMDPAARGAQP